MDEMIACPLSYEFLQDESPPGTEEALRVHKARKERNPNPSRGPRRIRKAFHT
jgi:hypothetical protein